MHVHHRGQERRVGSYVRRRTLLGGAGENPNQFPPLRHILSVVRHGCRARYAPVRAAGMAGRLWWLLRGPWRLGSRRSLGELWRKAAELEGRHIAGGWIIVTRRRRSTPEESLPPQAPSMAFGGQLFCWNQAAQSTPLESPGRERLNATLPGPARGPAAPQWAR